VHDGQPGGRDRGDGRGAAVGLDERDLSEEVPRSEVRDEFAVVANVRLALEHHEELVGHRALFEEVLPHADVHDVHPPCNLFAILGGKISE
jgi:hypothetical protein